MFLRRGVLLIHVALAVCCCLSCSRREAGLSYPGNGVPLLSRDKAIGSLNRELEQFAQANTGFVYDKAGLVFEGVSDVVFSSSQELVGEKFCLAVPVSIQSGVCEISIGEVVYRISSNDLILLNNGREVFRFEGDDLNEIVLEVYETSSSARFRLGWGRQTDVISVDIQSPARISILFLENCSGRIGLWRWLRGYV